jgi:hippurate hydrolase
MVAMGALQSSIRSPERAPQILAHDLQTASSWPRTLADVTTQLPPGADIKDGAAGLQPDTVELRRAIHKDPELGLDLPRTQSKILESLTGLGLDITLGESTTSVVAELDTGKPGPTILLRGDMDALPMNEDLDVDYRSANEGAMHACGHDAHVAMLAGAARLLAEQKSEFDGKVRFMFQPGEEGFHGAKYMLEEGVADGVDRAFAIHIFPTAPSGWIISRPGPLMASADRFELTVNGKGGHASMPHFTHDPIPAAAEIVTGLQTMVTRTVDANQPGVLTVGHINAGTTNNVIPEHAFIEGTIRTLNEHTRSSIHAGVERVATNIAAAHNCSCSVDIEDGYPVTVNHEAEVAHMAEVARATLGDDLYVTMPTPVMGAEDWSYVLNQVPGSMAFLGACPSDIADPRQAPPNHSNYMRIDEDAMANGVALYTAMAMAR